MSNLTAVTKVADKIITRLFDHRQFTNGEINHLVKELGEKSNLEDNLCKILKLNENVYVMNCKSSEDIFDSYNQTASHVSDKLTSLMDAADRILKLEDSVQPSRKH